MPLQIVSKFYKKPGNILGHKFLKNSNKKICLNLKMLSSDSIISQITADFAVFVKICLQLEQNCSSKFEET